MKPTSLLYRERWPEKTMRRELRSAIEHGIGTQQRLEIFFRADDIAIPSRQFSMMIEAFASTPLALALVPSWLSKQRFSELKSITGSSRRWCWHQHGRRHRNFESAGKKQEFGPARDMVVGEQIKLGWQRLHSIVGDELEAYFTPPWNRCSSAALEALVQQNFIAVSRSRGAKPQNDKLPDLAVNIDLHTRKESSAAESRHALLMEISNSLASGRAGIMLHHQRMNQRALELLQILIEELHGQPQIEIKTFRELIKTGQ